MRENIIENKIFGQRGEFAARRYLEKNGYKILKTNYRINHQEVDIIAGRNQKIIFVEVKTRRAINYIYRDNQISPSQLRSLRRATLRYASKNRLSLENISLDLINILPDPKGRGAVLKHYKNIG